MPLLLQLVLLTTISNLLDASHEFVIHLRLRIFLLFVVERYAIIDEKLVKDMKKILETNQTKLIEKITITGNSTSSK